MSDQRALTEDEERVKRLLLQVSPEGLANEEHPRVRRPAESVPVAEDIFTIADLGPALLDKGAPYTMPNGKKVFVHALSQRDQQTLLRWSGERREREHDITDPVRAQVLAQEIQRDVQVYVVILVCRVGEERADVPSFQKEDFGALRAYLKAGVVDEICRLADAQSGSAEGLSAGVRRFFGVTQRLCETLLLKCGNSAEFPESLRATLTRYASLASRATKLGGWDYGMTDELQDLAGLME